MPHAELTSPTSPAEASTPRVGTTSAWKRFWFEPTAATNLGFCRLLFFGLMFLYAVPLDDRGWHSIPASFWNPMYVFARFHLPVLNDGAMFVAQSVWKISLLLACVGLFSRISAGIAFVLSLYLIGVTYNNGKVEDMTAIAILSEGILALSLCGDAFSLDNLIFRRHQAPRPLSGEYRWPIRMIWTLMATVFFCAGFAKLRHSGLHWASPRQFGALLISRYYDPSPPPTHLGLFIAARPWLSIPMAAGSMMLEVGAPLALFSRHARWFIPAMLFGMQIGIGIIMSIWFTTFLFVYLFWVPWDELLNRLHVIPAVSADPENSPHRHGGH